MNISVRNTFHRARASKEAANSFWIISERTISVGITTIITVLSARYLGASNYGILSYGLSFVTLFLGLMKLGLDSVMVNELIRNRLKQGKYLGTSIILRLASSILSIIAIAILLFILNADHKLLIIIALIQSLILIFQSFNILDYWFQSHLKSKFVSIAKIIATTITAGYSAYILINGKDVIWFAFSIVLTNLVIGACLIIFYKKQGGDKLTFSLESAKYLLSKSHHFIIANIITLIYVQIDKVMVGNIISNEALGIYSAAVTIAMAWTFLPDSITTSLRPVILQAKEKSNVLYKQRLKQLYFILFWLSVGISIIITLFAPLIVHILFGSAYVNSAIIVQITVWAVPLSMLGTARNIWLVSENKQKYAKYILIYGVLVNVGLNLILLPMIGILGAAIATVATEIVTCFIAPLFYKPVREHTRILLEALIYRI